MIYLPKPSLLKNIFFLIITLFSFGIVQSHTIVNDSITSKNDTIEKYDNPEKKVNNTIKEIRKNKFILIPEKVKARIALENATTISNYNILNYKKAEVIEGAEEYFGTPYNYGGMTKNGIDCSALMLKAYDNIGFDLPRTSFAQSKIGKKIKKIKALPGDLVFFKTSRRNRVTHVGLITENNNGEIKFIHASSSKGVIESSLEENYYKKTYVKIKRILL